MAKACFVMISSALCVFTHTRSCPYSTKAVCSFRNEFLVSIRCGSTVVMLSHTVKPPSQMLPQCTPLTDPFFLASFLCSNLSVSQSVRVGRGSACMRSWLEASWTSSGEHIAHAEPFITQLSQQSEACLLPWHHCQRQAQYERKTTWVRTVSNHLLPNIQKCIRCRCIAWVGQQMSHWCQMSIAFPTKGTRKQYLRVLCNLNKLRLPYCIRLDCLLLSTVTDTLDLAFCLLYDVI